MSIIETMPSRNDIKKNNKTEARIRRGGGGGGGGGRVERREGGRNEGVKKCGGRVEQGQREGKERGGRVMGAVRNQI